METFVGPDMDTGVVRAYYGEAIAAYDAAAQALDANRVDIAAADFGEGFADRGARIAAALDALHGTTQDFLAARSRTWQSVLTLADDVEHLDASNAAAFGKVNGL